MDGNLEQCELIRISDNKPICMAAYETSRYVFLITATVINFSVQRGLKKENDLYVIYYDKYTGKTRATKADGFQDDLLGFTSFMPLYGACKDKLIRILYPYQVLEHVRLCNESGKKIDEKLVKLSQQIKENDNPILVMGHLKK